MGGRGDCAASRDDRQDPDAVDRMTERSNDDKRTEAHVAKQDPKASEQGWKALTWQDVEEWAGSRSLERGQSYQRSGRVSRPIKTPSGA